MAILVSKLIDFVNIGQFPYLHKYWFDTTSRVASRQTLFKVIYWKNHQPSLNSCKVKQGWKKLRGNLNTVMRNYDIASTSAESSGIDKKRTNRSFEENLQDWLADAKAQDQFVIDTSSLDTNVKRAVQSSFEDVERHDTRSRCSRALHTSSCKDNSLSEDGYHVELNARVEKVDSSLNARSEVELDPIMESVTSFVDKEDMHVPYIINYSKDLSIANEGLIMNKENNNLMENEDCSPPISSQLCELKFLVSSTPLCMQLPEEKFISLDDHISTITAEPEEKFISLDDDQISTKLQNQELIIPKT